MAWNSLNLLIRFKTNTICLKILIVGVRAKDKKIFKCMNLFQPSAAFRIETNHLICSVKQMTGFYTKRNSGLKCFKRGYRDRWEVTTFKESFI